MITSESMARIGEKKKPSAPSNLKFVRRPSILVRCIASLFAFFVFSLRPILLDPPPALERLYSIFSKFNYNNYITCFSFPIYTRCVEQLHYWDDGGATDCWLKYAWNCWGGIVALTVIGGIPGKLIGVVTCCWTCGYVEYVCNDGTFGA